MSIRAAHGTGAISRPTASATEVLDATEKRVVMFKAGGAIAIDRANGCKATAVYLDASSGEPVVKNVLAAGSGISDHRMVGAYEEELNGYADAASGDLVAITVFGKVTDLKADGTTNNIAAGDPLVYKATTGVGENTSPDNSIAKIIALEAATATNTPIDVFVMR